MKKLWSIIAGAFGLILAALFIERTKNKNLEALNDNNEAMKEKNALDVEIVNNNALLNVEEIKRKEQVDALKGNNEELSAKNLVDFFNRRK